MRPILYCVFNYSCINKESVLNGNTEVIALPSKATEITKECLLKNQFIRGFLMIYLMCK